MAVTIVLTRAALGLKCRRSTVLINWIFCFRQKSPQINVTEMLRQYCTYLFDVKCLSLKRWPIKKDKAGWCRYFLNCSLISSQAVYEPGHISRYLSAIPYVIVGYTCVCLKCTEMCDEYFRCGTEIDNSPSKSFSYNLYYKRCCHKCLYTSSITVTENIVEVILVLHFKPSPKI